MKFLKAIAFLLLCITLQTNLSAQTTRRVLNISGAISEKYPIKMTLTFHDEMVFGYYFYEKYQTKILLVGQIEGNQIILNESPDYESEFKIGFVGNISNKLFTGIWTDKVKNKTLDFSSQIVSDELVIISNNIFDTEGVYDNINNSNTFFSSINLMHITGDIFCFEISTGTESGCIGFLKGLIHLNELNQGEYSASSCNLMRISISNDLVISEDNCDFHGYECSFDGHYRKK